MLARLLIAFSLATAPAAFGARGEITAEDRKWWAFQPVTDPQPPTVEDAAGWIKNEIDRFVLRELKAANLSPAPEASARELIRRVTFDLTGLPPTPAEIEAFEKDPSPDAYDRLVDRLLASPRHGERWARHWLDLVRYAESDGYKADDFRPNAWRYRDYVIRSLNADKPYNQFMREQIAGDELAPDDPDALIATGYLRAGIYEYNNRDVVGQWAAILNDLTDTTSDVFMGMGLQCARCHDHKFDPLLQKDYFRLQAFFSSYHPQDNTVVAPADQKEAYGAKVNEWKKQTEAIRTEIEKLEAKYRATAETNATSKFPEETQAIMAKAEKDRTPLEKQLGTLAYNQVTYEFDRIDAAIKGSDKEKMVQLRKQLAEFDKLKPEPIARALTATDIGNAAPPVVIPKKESLGEVDPGIPTILDPNAMSATPTNKTTGRRLALANWLADGKNPLTTRVMVNRVWGWHFGRGLTATTSDFGRLGTPPTHPELLDWLTARFVSEGWSLKKLHRRIVLSAAYRQSAQSPIYEEARVKDPENKLLWRWTTQRLEAEEIRDALLAVTGELDLSEGGPSVDFTKARRTIYNKVLRNVRDPLLDVFDSPQHFNSTATRDATTTAVQSLLLINNRYLMDRAQALAGRLRRDYPDQPEAQVEAAFQLAFGRKPSADERLGALEFLKSQAQQAPEPKRTENLFVAEPMPERLGKAAVLAPGSGQERLVLAGQMPRPDGDFSVEAVVLLRSVYDSGDVRVISSAWDGGKDKAGWALGITSKKSQRKPQMLVLQMTGKGVDGATLYEPVFSDLQIQLDRSYYVGASVHLGGPGDGAVTFFVKDLANDDEPLQTTVVPHPIASGVNQPEIPVVIGGRSGKGSGHQWDGLIDEVRISRGQVGADQCFFKADALSPAVAACWQFEPKPGYLRDAVSNEDNLKAVAPEKAEAEGGGALADFCHALLNASELLYVN